MSEFWDREVVEQQHFAWMSLLPVRVHINELIGGDRPLWPIEWFERWLQGRTFARALTVGCGSGNLDRQLIQRGLCQTVDGFDGSITSLAIARAEAKQAGLASRIRYFASDFNHTVLPRRKYDIVFFHQSAHHVARLERLFQRILQALKPDGLIYLDEYVGPSRFEWSDEVLAPQQSFFERLPPQIRRLDRLPLPIQQDDPSEAFRSSEIEAVLRIGFDIAARRPYGGTLLAVVLPHLKLELFSDADLASVIAHERELLAAGMPSFYAIVVGRPKRGLRKWLAVLRYMAIRLARRISSEWNRVRARS
jgi:SAM-dependent methyltransferase